jgi:hypothetical protein
MEAHVEAPMEAHVEAPMEAHVEAPLQTPVQASVPSGPERPAGPEPAPEPDVWSTAPEVGAPPPGMDVGGPAQTPAGGLAAGQADGAATRFFSQPSAPPPAHDPEGPPTQDLQDASARLAAMHADDEIDEGGTGLRPRHLALIVIIPIVVFGLSLLAATLLLRPKVPDHPAAAAATKAPSAQPSSAVSPVASPAKTPVPTPVPSAAVPPPTPFQLVPSPVRASAAFTQGTGACPGFPPGAAFSDNFMFTTTNGTLTLKQLSTNDVTSGPVQPDGSFAVKAADSKESYAGKISGLTATANYEYNAAGCKQTYTVNFKFQP